MKNKENEKFSRSFSYAPRTFRVCFGSDLRLSCTYVGFILRFVIIVYYHKYTKVVFNLLHTFILTILIQVLSVVHLIYQYYYFFYKRIKSHVLGLKYFLLSVLSSLGALTFSFFLSDLSALVVKISLSNHLPQVSSLLNHIFVIGY